MCQPLPGPRCAGHARKRLDRISKQYRQELEKFNTDGFSEAKFLSLKGKYKDAQLEYDSTPTGQSVLKEKMSSSSSKRHREQFEARLKAGKMLRQWRMNAVRQQSTAVSLRDHIAV